MYKPAANQRVPSQVMEARKEIMVALGGTKVCTRCDGLGHVNRPDWVVVAKTGLKTCFRCWGSCVEMTAGRDPLEVRYALVDVLLPLVNEGRVAEIVSKEMDARGNPYWAIQADVFERAIKAAANIRDEDDRDDFDFDGEEEYDRQEREAVWGAYDRLLI